MIKIKVLILASIIVLASCQQEDSIPDTTKSESNLVNNLNSDASTKSSSIPLDFDTPCSSSTTLYVSNPFNEDLAGGPVQGWHNNQIDCYSPNSECFGVQLRQQLIKEFSRHTNNISCGLKGTACPPGTLIASFEDYGLDLENQFGFEISDDGFQPSEANLIYQEFLCRIFDEAGNGGFAHYLVIEEMFLDTELCTGCQPILLNYKIDVYRTNL